MCEKDTVVGISGRNCSRCGQPFVPSKLLYPDKHKVYLLDRFIKSEWDILRRYLGKAYYLTVYGYSAPKTDVEARSLMLDVWRKNKYLELAEVDVVDTATREALEASWEEFFFSHHYTIFDNMADSYLFRHPRRSCDAFASETLKNKPWHNNTFPKFDRLEDLQSWVVPLIGEEVAYERERKPFSDLPLHPNGVDDGPLNALPADAFLTL